MNIILSLIKKNTSFNSINILIFILLKWIFVYVSKTGGYRYKEYGLDTDIPTRQNWWIKSVCELRK